MKSETKMRRELTKLEEHLKATEKAQKENIAFWRGAYHAIKWVLE